MFVFNILLTRLTINGENGGINKLIISRNFRSWNLFFPDLLNEVVLCTSSDFLFPCQDSKINSCQFPAVCFLPDRFSLLMLRYAPVRFPPFFFHIRERRGAFKAELCYPARLAFPHESGWSVNRLHLVIRSNGGSNYWNNNNNNRRKHGRQDKKGKRKSFVRQKTVQTFVGSHGLKIFETCQRLNRENWFPN